MRLFFSYEEICDDNANYSNHVDYLCDDGCNALVPQDYEDLADFDIVGRCYINFKNNIDLTNEKDNISKELSRIIMVTV